MLLHNILSREDNMKMKRYIPSAICAVGVTTLIGLFMARMIAVEFKPQKKEEPKTFNVNPVEPDIELDIIRKEQPLLVKVETPPPPPKIIRQRAEKPQERIGTVTRADSIFTVPKIIHITKTVVSDRDSQPFIRIPPVMPPRAEKSGHCKVWFDVSPEGSTHNVIANYCTQALFKRPAIKSAQKWKYKPKISGGRPVSRSGVESIIRFRLTDARGELIPE